MASVGVPQPEAVLVLQELRQRVGAPSGRQLSACVESKSATTMFNVYTGRGSHRRDTVRSFVVACLEYARRYHVDSQLAPEHRQVAYWLQRYDEAVKASRQEVRGSGGGERNLRTGQSVRTRYVAQVRRIAPEELVDRGTELAELARFCTSAETAGRYWWWRAPAWSGKTALMSWFVLHPPEGVRVVSFFVTARFFSQNNRAAFIDNVLDQLLSLLDQDLPSLLTESTREMHLLQLLTEGAEACRDRDEQLVFVVDGLDEDRGVTVGADAHSIAALLPAQLPAGMRVIVAGRDNPPIPTDVPNTHPLREPGVVRALEPSPCAEAIRVDMERELKSLMLGTATERDLLGVLAAAGGGLSAEDLAELTTMSTWSIRDHLRTVTGRSFASRERHNQPGGAAEEVYQLGHQELQVMAVDMLRPAELEEYRLRLHKWAERYQTQGWPATTPEYLLRDYFDMLNASGDLRRMIDCATDIARHDRLRDLSGGDVLALSEISKAHERIPASHPPDLVAAARLAVHRDYLADRNAEVPVDLPTVWVLLHNPDRGEALARSLSSTYQQCQALALVTDALLETGEQQRAVDVINYAETLARRRADHQHVGLRAVAAMMVKIGEFDRAEALAHCLAGADNHKWAVEPVAEALVKANELGRAEQLAQSLNDPMERDEAEVAVAKATAEAGDRARAVMMLNDVEDRLGSFIYPGERNKVAVALAGARAWTGELERAKQIALSIRDFYPRIKALISVADAVAATSEPNIARGIAYQVEDELYSRPRYGWMLGSLIDVWIKVGDIARAEQLALALTDPFGERRALEPVTLAWVKDGKLAQAERLASSLTDLDERDRVHAVIARTLAEAGNLVRAEQFAKALTNSYRKCTALTVLARELVEAEDREHAVEIVSEAELLAQSQTDAIGQVRRWTALAVALVEVDEQQRATKAVSRAEPLVHLISDDGWQLGAWQQVINAMARAGDLARAKMLADSFVDLLLQSAAVTAIAEAAAAMGDAVEAENLLNSYFTPDYFDPDNEYFDEIAYGYAAASVAKALVDANETEYALKVIDRAVTVIDPNGETIGSLIDAMVKAGDLTRARRMTEHIDNLYSQIETLASIAEALAKRGQLKRAVRIINQAEKSFRDIKGPIGADRQCSVLTALARALDEAGERTRAVNMIDRTEALAGTIADSFKRNWALKLVADALIKVDALNRAEAIADLMTDSDRQRQVLTTLTQLRYASTPEVGIAQALTFNRWHTQLESLVQHSPEVVVAIFDELALLQTRNPIAL